MVDIQDGTYHCQTPKDLEIEMFRHNCQTVEELDGLVWSAYGRALVLDYLT